MVEAKAMRVLLAYPNLFDSTKFKSGNRHKSISPIAGHQFDAPTRKASRNRLAYSNCNRFDHYAFTEAARAETPLNSAALASA
jgi:hypothetical protein